MKKQEKRDSSWWYEKLRESGHRLTIPRKAILDVLSNSHNHPSAEEIYFAVHKVYSNIGLTTIYRTLDLFIQTGLIFKFDFGDGKARYELTEGPGGPQHHHHLVCTRCYRVINYTDFVDEELELVKRTEKELSKKFGFSIDNHLIQFYGVCKRCRKNES
jgi:Fur family ferric uptake transcriptional regulator